MVGKVIVSLSVYIVIRVIIVYGLVYNGININIYYY